MSKGTSNNELVGKILAELRSWSPLHYIFDALVTLLLTTAYAWFADLNFWQAAWIAFLLFGVIGTGMMLYRRRRIPLSFQDFIDMERVRDVTRAALAVSNAIEMFHAFTEQCPAAASPDYQERYTLWRAMVRAYIRGTLRPEIAEMFDKRAQNLTDPAPIKMFLVGLVTTLTKDDLRSRCETNAFVDSRESIVL